MVYGIRKKILISAILIALSAIRPVMASAAELVEGDMRSLPALAIAGCLDESPVLIFRDQISPATENLLQIAERFIFADATVRDMAIDISRKKEVFIVKSGVVSFSEGDMTAFYLDTRSLSPNELQEIARYQVRVNGKPLVAVNAQAPESRTQAYHYLGAQKGAKGRHKIDLFGQSGRLLMVSQNEVNNNEAALIALLDQSKDPPLFMFSVDKSFFYLPRSYSGRTLRVVVGRVFDQIKLEKYEEFSLMIDDSVYTQPDFNSNAGEAYPSLEISLEPGWHTLSVPRVSEDRKAWTVLQPAGEPSAPAAAVKLPSLDFKRVSPAKFRVRVKGANGPFWLILGERFHELWRLYAEPPASWDKTADSRAFQPKDVSYLWRAPLATPHFQVNGFANGWYVDPASLPKPGSDFDITIFFWPQALTYFSYGFTGLVFLVSAWVLAARIFLRWKRAHKK